MKILALLLWLAPSAGAAQWTLDTYTRELFSVSYDLKRSEESLQVSENSDVYSLASFWVPSVTLSAANTPYSSWNSPRLNFANSRTSAGLSASLNLFNNFRDKLDVDSSRLSRDSSEVSLFTEKQTLTVTALNNYYEVLRKKQLVRVAQKSLASYEEQYAKAQQYYKEGLKSYSDVLKSELNYRSSQLSEMSAEESCRTSLMSFNTAIYREPEEAADLAEVSGQPDLTMPDLQADLRYAMENRPDLRQAGIALEQKRISRKLARIGWWPDFSVDAAYSRQGLLGLGITGSPVYSVGASLTLPIGLGTLSDRNANISAQIGLDQAERAMLEAVLAAKKEIITAWHSRAVALKSYEVARMSADISAQNLAIVKERYGQGRASMIELDDAQSDDQSSQTSLANSFFDLLLNRLEYDRTVGRQVWH